MQRPSDEKLIAYLDGELAAGERAEIALWLERDAELRERLAQFGESAALIRAAFDEVLREPLPERLIAAARGDGGKVVDLAKARGKPWRAMLGDRRWWIGVPLAATLSGLLIGGGLGYIAAGGPGGGTAPQVASVPPSTNWLDSLAGYHKLFVNAGSDDVTLVDVPPSDAGDVPRKAAQKLPPDFRLPNLKPWGLVFQGARFLIIEGRPAIQLFYTTDDKALGPLTVVVGSSVKPDIAPTFDRRDDVNLLYWRHHGHSYALVGTAEIGYLWNISKDIAYQLDAI